MSIEVIRNYTFFFFCRLVLCDRCWKFNPHYQPMRGKTITYHDLVICAFPLFRLLRVFFLIRLLIGSLKNFSILWLAAVVSLVLLPSHSIKMCSQWIEVNQLITRPPMSGMWVCRATYHLITCHVQPSDWFIRKKWNGNQLIDILISQQLSITSFLASPGSLLWKFNGALIAKNPLKKT